MNRSIITGVLLVAMSAAAGATSTDWTTVEGGRIRLVTDAHPQPDGTMRAALDIQLDPGWKTYWLDPGSAGVPPSFTMETDQGPLDVSIDFPPPKRFSDRGGDWAGYDRSVALPVTVHVPETARGTAEAQAFIGICETICIPVQAQWTITLDGGPAHDADLAVIEAAFAGRPAEARPGFMVSASRVSADALLLEAEIPPNAIVSDLFVAGTESLSLAAPVRGDGTRFRVPVIGLYGKQPWSQPLRYTLVTSAGAVHGTLSLD